MKQFYADVMLLSVDCFRKNRPEDAEIPFLGPGGVFEARIDSPRRFEGQHQRASRSGRNISAAEIAAARRAAAIDQR